MVLFIDDKQDMKDVSFYFLEDLKKVYPEHGGGHVNLDLLPISAAKAGTKAYCFQSTDNLIVYIKSRETFLGSKYARMSTEFYRNYFSADMTLFGLNPFTKTCQDQCSIEQLNLHRNSTHQVVSMQSKAEINRNQNMPIWVIEKADEMMAFSIESCFE